MERIRNPNPTANSSCKSVSKLNVGSSPFAAMNIQITAPSDIKSESDKNFFIYLLSID